MVLLSVGITLMVVAMIFLLAVLIIYRHGPNSVEKIVGIVLLFNIWPFFGLMWVVGLILAILHFFFPNI